MTFMFFFDLSNNRCIIEMEEFCDGCHRLSRDDAASRIFRRGAR